MSTDAEARRQDQPERCLHVFLRRGDHVAPGGAGGGHTGAEEGQRSLGQDGVSEDEGSLYQQRGEQIRQQVDGNDAARSGAEGLGCFDELQLAQHERGAAGNAGDARCVDGAERDHDVGQ